MNRVPIEASAALRARWLAELAEALEEARLLVKQLGGMQGRVEAAELLARIQAIGLEVEAIRLAARTAAAMRSDPEWSNNLPWQRQA